MTAQAASRIVTVPAPDHDDSAVATRRGLALLALALLRPFLGDALDGGDDGSSAFMTAPPRRTCRGRCIRRAGRRRAGRRSPARRGRRAARAGWCRGTLPKAPSARNGLRMPGDQLTPVISRRSSLRLVAAPAESGLDDEGDALVVVVLDLAVVEALHLAAGARSAPRSARGR